MAKGKKPATRSGRRNNMVSMDTAQAMMIDEGGGGGGGTAWASPVLQPAAGDQTADGGIQAIALPVYEPPTGPVFNTEPIDATEPVPPHPILTVDYPAPVDPGTTTPDWSSTAQGYPAPSDPAQDEHAGDPILDEVHVGQDGNVNVGPQIQPPVAGGIDMPGVTTGTGGTIQTVGGPSGTALLPGIDDDQDAPGIAWYWWVLIALGALVLIVIIAKTFKK